ncbi:MAG: Unknown protein [uncultured Sulfurovum sp.]|uniref:Peptidase A2 domain-containing protein n=1 Tax=uncultured Sulfurovum sp. TaxID=269237 RepID=A0A6S6TG06_9BACT|nr:MAG: Unknown protein [uncultured Sulfurovum sp.]
MFNLLLALITGVVIGWNFHSFFLELNPNPLKILKDTTTIEEISQTTQVAPTILEEKEVQQAIHLTKAPQNILPKITLDKETNTSISTTVINENFYTLLEKNLFSDAMTLYIDAKGTTHSLYQAALLDYFEDTINTEPQLATEQMIEFQELEPKDRRVEEELLHDMQFGDDYTARAMVLLELIKQKNEVPEAYQFQIPLQKVGEHFTVEVEVNNTPIVLLLDTGASITMVNEAKLPLLTLINENVVLSAVGRKINAQLHEADTFSIGEVELEKFQIVSSTFEQEKADGLLGMNFFKEFKFKIDQQTAILHLSQLEE